MKNRAGQAFPPISSQQPAHIYCFKGALSKVKQLSRVEYKTAKVRMTIMGDSNDVPIDAIAASSREYGAAYIFEKKCMGMRRNASKNPQGGYIKAVHQGGGVKPLDSLCKDAGSSAIGQVFRGDGACYGNLSGSAPPTPMGSLMFPATAFGHRIMYLVIDTRVNTDPTLSGPLELRDCTKVYIEFGNTAAASGNNPDLPLGAQKLDGTGTTPATETGISLGNMVCTVTDASALTLTNPLSAANIIAIDALAATGVGTSATTVAGAGPNGFYWSGSVHATSLTIQANKLNVIKCACEAGKQFMFTGIIWEDSQTNGFVLYDRTSSGNSDQQCRYNQFDTSGNITYVAGNPVLAPLDTAFAYGAWLGQIEAVPQTTSHVTLGTNFLVDLNCANDIAGGLHPLIVAAHFKEKCQKMEASASGAKGVVIKYWWEPEAAVGNENGFRPGTGTGTTSGYKTSDYEAALKDVVRQFPNTAIFISMIDYHNRKLPSVIQNDFNDSGVYGDVGSSDLLHRNIHTRTMAMGDAFSQLLTCCTDNG